MVSSTASLEVRRSSAREGLHGPRRQGHHLCGHGFCRRVQRFGRHHLVDEAAAQRLGGLHAVTEHQQFEGAPLPHQLRNKERAARLRRETELHERHLEERPLRRDHEVAVEQQRGADAYGSALHGHEQRLVEGRYGLQEAQHRRVLTKEPAAQEVVQVVAGAEHVAIGADDHESNVRVGRGGPAARRTAPHTSLRSARSSALAAPAGCPPAHPAEPPARCSTCDLLRRWATLTIAARPRPGTTIDARARRRTRPDRDFSRGSAVLAGTYPAYPSEGSCAPTSSC